MFNLENQKRIHSSEIQLGAAHVGDTNVAAPSGEPYGVSYIIVEGPHTGENPPQHAAHSTAQHSTGTKTRATRELHFGDMKWPGPPQHSTT